MAPVHRLAPAGRGPADCVTGINLMAAREWKLGDRLVHAGRPEWGIGEVRAAEATTQDGVRCQRLTIRFDRAGVKTISTAFADLKTPEEVGTLPEPVAEEESGSGLDKAGGAGRAGGAARVPESG